MNYAAGTQWSAAAMADYAGKNILVTGSNSGLGYEIAKFFAGKKANVIMACRSFSKGQQAAKSIRSYYHDACINIMELNLASLESVRCFVQGVRSMYTRLDLLFNNAGVMATPYTRTKDGFELQFGTNHLGHFALTGLLLELICSNLDSRIVTMSSAMNTLCPLKFDSLNKRTNYNKWLAYGQSKLANLLFAFELQRRLSRALSSTISIAAHPGWAKTNLQRHTGFFGYLNPYLAQSGAQGALPALFAATSSNVKGGEFYGPDGFMEMRGSPARAMVGERARNCEDAQKLWQISEEMTGVCYSFPMNRLAA
ncbi:MAG: SDR family NAD(P)-dependent oxidoreductase [Chitinivibrionales bacterium]|nr:SDR family NAD(P)-dependent oxidoreductase [Chitinivibrionales bacterium]